MNPTPFCPAWLNELRFDYEDWLFHDLARLPQIRVDTENTARHHHSKLRKRHLMGTAVQITEDLFPSLYSVYQACLHRLGGNIEGRLYVYQASEYNAGVYAHQNSFDILVTSALIKDFTEAQLAFVIGHELGHVLYAHNTLPAQNLLFNEQARHLPLDLAKQLLQWTRAAEISADRIGFLMCGDLGQAANAFFKLAGGLQLEDDNLVLRALHRQFEEIERLTRETKDGPGYATTHPLIPIRFKSLELISLDLLALRNTGKSIKARELSTINQKVREVLQNTEPPNIQAESETDDAPPNANSSEFAALLVLSLLYTALSDAPLSAREEEYIRGLVPPRSGINPESVIQDARGNPAAFKQNALEEIRNCHPPQDIVLQILHHCAYLSPILKQEEIQAMQEVCAALGGTPDVLKNILSAR